RQGSVAFGLHVVSALALVDTRHEYYRVFDVYVPIALAAFVVFAGAIVWAALRYRGRSPAAASRRHESNRLEAGYALILACIVAFLLYVTFSAEHQVDVVSAHERPSLTIDVTASQWEWTFRYPAYGITQRSGFVGSQPLVVPVDTAVRFNLLSADVIHSFWIPQLRFKRDLLPGETEPVTLDFDQVGTFGGQCGEFCGLRHAEMVFTVTVVSGQRFQVWARSGGRRPE
ncbi:MAG TPA: cytochrome c oxidase subunit II, partial [Solirubrobacteraceae bacterium]